MDNFDNSIFVDDFEKDLIIKALRQTSIDKMESIKPRQIRDIVPIERWLEDSFYSGPDAMRIYPYWKDVLCELFKKDNVQTKYKQLINEKFQIYDAKKQEKRDIKYKDIVILLRATKNWSEKGR